mgnify:CR=1 FL=1
MLRPRIIPTLLLHNKGLYKTVNFNTPKYVGDPINAVKIFNEKEVDELILLDIDATVKEESPNFELIKKIANECRMPFCYGGGIKKVSDAEKIISLGVEKIALSSVVIKNLKFISDVSKSIGVQSVVVILDYKKTGFFKKNQIFINNGNQNTHIELYDFIYKLNKIGIGELVLNSIDKDGTGNGFDLITAKKVRLLTNFPLTILGGANSFGDIMNLIDEFGIIGASAGSLFVFKGKYKAVLINYPNIDDKNSLIK